MAPGKVPTSGQGQQDDLRMLTIDNVSLQHFAVPALTIEWV